MHTIKRFALMLFTGLLFLAAGEQAMARQDTPPHLDPLEPRIALVIGNANYADQMTLANPAKDAVLIGTTLEKLGFEVILVTDAGQKQMQRAMVDFGDRLAKAGPDAVGLFYYAGHGLQLEGQNYLVPVDADISREVDVEIDGVSADLVLKQMAYAESRVNIVILDACRNNPLARDYRSAAASEGFAEIRSKPKGTFISYSTAPGEVAVDGSDGHSPFARALAKSMQLPGLDLPEVFQHVRQDVLAATEERQTPWDSSSLVRSFYFVPATENLAKDDLVAAAEPALAPTVVTSTAVTPAVVASTAVAPAVVAPVAVAPTVVAMAQPEPAAKPALQEAEATPLFVTQTRSLFAKPGSRLRAEPSKDATILAKLPANAELRAIARSKDGAWWEVSTRQGAKAYVHADAVTDFRAARAPKAPAKPVVVQQTHTATTSAASRSSTGIGVVDQALDWLKTTSANGTTPQNSVRASR